MAVDPADIILIGDLPSIAVPMNDYLIPVYKNGQTSYMTVAQVLGLFATASYTAADIAFVPGSGIIAVNVQAAIQEAIADMTALIGGKFSIADGTLVAAQAGVEAVQRTWTAAMLKAAAIAAGGGIPDVIMEDQKASGTNGGSYTSGSWAIRTLNTKVRDPGSLMTLSGSTFVSTVAGRVEWSAPGYGIGGHKTRLWNITDGTVDGIGSADKSASGTDCSNRSVGVGLITAGKTYRLEHQGNQSGSNGLGFGGGFSTIEVYSQVNFWRSQ